MWIADGLVSCRNSRGGLYQCFPHFAKQSGHNGNSLKSHAVFNVLLGGAGSSVVFAAFRPNCVFYQACLPATRLLIATRARGSQDTSAAAVPNRPPS